MERCFEVESEKGMAAEDCGGLVVVQLLQLSGRALAAQARCHGCPGLDSLFITRRV